MWSVRAGRLYCGRDLVAVRRVVVERMAGRTVGPVADGMARHMIRMERALSLYSLAQSLSRKEGMA